MLKVVYRNNQKIESDRDDRINTLAKIIQANHEKREMKKILKSQAEEMKKNKGL